MARLGEKKVTPDGVKICNPVFDVTLAGNIAVIISEKSIIRHLMEKKIRQMLEQKL